MSIVDNFENLDPSYIPDNSSPIIKPTPTIIITGETCTISYELDLSRNNIETLIGRIKPEDKSVIFMFKNGIEKPFDDRVATIIPTNPNDEDNSPIIVKCELSPEETLKINPYLDFEIQVKIILVDGTTSYTKKDKAIVKRSLEL